MTVRALTIGLVGAGMFGGDVHLRAYAQLQRGGLLPWLGRLGLDDRARDLGDVRVDFVALATNTPESGLRKREEFGKSGMDFALYHGETPWVELLNDFPGLDILAVATPDHLHTAPILAALDRGVHVITEKPMSLDADEADEIIAASRRAGRLVGVDMHKRYDPDHLRIRDDIARRIGEPLYGRAVLEEPLSVSTGAFAKWAEKSDPFSYVGCHWTDLHIAYFGVKPVSLHAVGQKKKLRRDFGMDAFDAVQVKVQYDNGMSIDYVNSWILPDGFEAPVNQESQLFGTDGLVESDSQYRGLRFLGRGGGMRTANTHFTRDVRREDGSLAYVGYGVDSLVVCVEKVAEMKFLGKTLDEVAPHYPNAEEARLSVLIVHAAREVARRNFEHTEAGRGAPVTAVFGPDGITVYDPFSGPVRIYGKAV
ncbi:MAG: Gfo/Idh/MocA family oxidoreductase [Candidatus Hydrogenedens sp.]|nr:Gfo/Idh/MocA family oxidoreductase [Candidatus Hydrogenedentota bacterium]NLF59262.1 Gfo/Idh/MocA family oxidoreductase [Candidatus Hydrogenedens sp.]